MWFSPQIVFSCSTRMLLWRQIQATSGVRPPANRSKALPIRRLAIHAKRFGPFPATHPRTPLPKKCRKPTACRSWTLPWQVCIVQFCSNMLNCWIIFVCVSLLPDPTKMGGLSMLLLAGEHALTNREVGACHRCHFLFFLNHFYCI